VTKTTDKANEILPHPDDIFRENLYEHSDSVVAIEKNFIDSKRFATASKDGSVVFWKFAETGSDELVTFDTVIEPFQFSQGSNFHIRSVTGIKWYEAEVIAASLTDGTV